jgi:dTDP-glucose 4,6-dehydratase
MILITGGAGFIGSNFLRSWLTSSDESVVNLDALTYAGNLDNLQIFQSDRRHLFVEGTICDQELVDGLFKTYRPRAIVHFAAESHVDRSICGPDSFLETNISGTFTLLKAAHRYWDQLTGDLRDNFRFLHVSTDEVYGSLGPSDPPFSESTPYAPNSPYAATKAASDHLVRAWYHTYGFPVLTTHCSNNYGPYQFPEKLIPLMISNALLGKSLPLYGDGQNVRDWLYVEDHCRALQMVLDRGIVGEVYSIGGCHEVTNLEVVTLLCTLLDHLKPDPSGSYARLVSYVSDRPGHDRRYAIDASKIQRDLGWSPSETFKSGLEKTVRWYLQNQTWVSRVQMGAHQEWIRQNYGDRS